MTGNHGLPHTEFSPRDWELAPRYTSPVSHPKAVVLEFARLRELADQEKQIGSFRKSRDGTMAKAPLFIDDLPAAFYRIDTTYEQFTPNHNTTELETIVVINGILKVASNDSARNKARDRSMDDMFYEGHLVELQAEAVSMQAVGIIDPASCLAVALYRDRDLQVVPVLN